MLLQRSVGHRSIAFYYRPIVLENDLLHTHRASANRKLDANDRQQAVGHRVRATADGVASESFPIVEVGSS